MLPLSPPALSPVPLTSMHRPQAAHQSLSLTQAGTFTLEATLVTSPVKQEGDDVGDGLSQYLWEVALCQVQGTGAS